MRKFVCITALSIFCTVSANGATGCIGLFKGETIEFKEPRGPNTAFIVSLSTDFLRLLDFKIDEQSFPQTNVLKVGEVDSFRVDEQYIEQVSARRALQSRYPESVFQKSEKVSPSELWSAGNEIIQRVALELSTNYPQYFAIKNNRLVNRVLGESVSLTAKGGRHPLAKAGRMLQEDLVLVRRSEAGQYEMAAAFMGSPSAWTAQTYIGRSIEYIHRGIGNEGLIHKMLDRLQPGQPFSRNNWLVYLDPTLSQFQIGNRWYPPGGTKLPETLEQVPEKIYLRFEYQTLHRLSSHPEYVLFTIRPYVYRVGDVLKIPGMDGRIKRGLEKRYEDHDLTKTKNEDGWLYRYLLHSESEKRNKNAG